MAILNEYKEGTRKLKESRKMRGSAASRRAGVKEIEIPGEEDMYHLLCWESRYDASVEKTIRFPKVVVYNMQTFDKLTKGRDGKDLKVSLLPSKSIMLHIPVSRLGNAPVAPAPSPEPQVAPAPSKPEAAEGKSPEKSGKNSGK